MQKKIAIPLVLLISFILLACSISMEGINFTDDEELDRLATGTALSELVSQLSEERIPRHRLRNPPIFCSQLLLQIPSLCPNPTLPPSFLLQPRTSIASAKRLEPLPRNIESRAINF